MAIAQLLAERLDTDRAIVANVLGRPMDSLM
jgi:hypothetical protein